VAIRALAGFDQVLASGPARGDADVNLVESWSEQPTVAETEPSAEPRLLVHADVARVGDRDPRPELAGITLEGTGRDTVQLRLSTGEVAMLAVGPAAPAAVTLAGWTFEGPSLRVVRVGPDSTWLAAESVVSVAGAFRAAGSGPVEVRRLTDGRVLVGTTTAIEVDVRWAQRAPRGMWVLEHDGWSAAGMLDVPGVVDTALIGRLQARTGHRFLWLLLGDA
jgi:hypothetical protein